MLLSFADALKNSYRQYHAGYHVRIITESNPQGVVSGARHRLEDGYHNDIRNCCKSAIIKALHRQIVVSL